MRFFARQAAQIDLGGVIFDCKYFSPTFFVDAAEDEKGIEREGKNQRKTDRLFFRVSATLEMG